MSDKPLVTIGDLDRAPADLPGEATTSDPIFVEKLKENFARVTEEKTNLELEIQDIKRKNRTGEILDGLIEPYANRAFNFMYFYCGAVGIIIVANSGGLFKVPISDSVMQILVGSTAATVIGLVGMVLTGVFVGARGK